MALYAEDPLSGEGLVWGSEVNIEINPQDDSKRTSVLDPFARQSTDTAPIDFPEYPESVRLPIQAYHQHKCETPFSTADDADDEGSLYVKSPSPGESLQPPTDVRGRPRSRTNQLRRRGIDLSRDELGISSRWSSGEKKSMENFRDAIREKAKHRDGDDALFTKWTARRGRPFFKDARAIKDKVTKSWRSNISRSRGPTTGKAVVESGSNHVKENHDSNRNSGHTGQEVAGGLPKQQMTLRQVRSSISIRKQSPSPSPTSSSYECSSFPSRQSPNTTHISTHHQDRKTSWQRHLQHDLQPNPDRQLRHKKARYLLQEELKEKQEVEARNEGRRILPSDYFPDHNHDHYHELRHGSAAQPLLQPSLTMSAISQRDVEKYWRLPSLASTHAPLTPSYSYSEPRLERLDEITSSGDFENAWWASGSRNTSTSVSSVPPPPEQNNRIPRSPTTDLVTALKARIAHSNDDHEKSSARPLLQASSSNSYFSGGNMPDTPPATVDSERYYARLPQSRITSGRLVSSMSLPEGLGLDGGSRSSSYRYDQDDEDVGENESERDKVAAEMRTLALHPLRTRLPCENLVRPSVSMGLGLERRGI
ncbi:hypothetical protein OHC33_009760 [Knufia fluminis]|uniref:Uncharacterized protein n=1 Tax=Knufia fluminis TaxID=191047 RepID=A0AAN8I2R9_9EURO|nr:hypothetical protein OHC33_009760 [Knufia fluminis]